MDPLQFVGAINDTAVGGPLTDTSVAQIDVTLEMIDECGIYDASTPKKQVIQLTTKSSEEYSKYLVLVLVLIK